MVRKNKKYSLSFVEEAVLNSDYFGCVGGRVEVYGGGSYVDNEIRFFFKGYDYNQKNPENTQHDTPKMRKWSRFREYWNFKNCTDKELKKLENIIKKEWYKIDRIKVK
jgi:hypothetical protein